ncbi:MAG: PKD domain-containing protein, partial [Candidatus Sumerlaeia bacterium]|nr:PKD domain-containing protein [Candidatus Sumerlaeia bacterium]
ANFSQDVTSGKAPLTVHFTDLSSGSPTSWNWNFGDGSSSSAQHPAHTYTTPGSYLVSLTVSNYSGSDTQTNSVLIMVEPQTDSVIIPNVPDINQPPTQIIPATNPTNFSAPIATVNITEYWDYVIKHHNALLVNADLTSPTVAEYIGYFMDTNNCGSPHRGNGGDGHSGTYVKDQMPGIIEFVRWDATHPFDAPPATPPAIPPLKLGYDWFVTPYFGGDWNVYKAEIDAGRPALVTFLFWNPLPEGVTLYNLPTGEEVDIYSWEAQITGSQYAYLQGSPEETWNLQSGEMCIGHTVTGVGYIENWDPDDSGPLPLSNFAIVHDTWDTTAKNVGIPWQNCNAVLSFVVQPSLMQVGTIWTLYK